jgi:hypothetical protein
VIADGQRRGRRKKQIDDEMGQGQRIYRGEV